MIKLWNLLSGWKTVIAAIYWPLVTQVLPIWFPNGEPPTLEKTLSTIGILLTVVGVGHKAWKAANPDVAVPDAAQPPKQG